MEEEKVLTTFKLEEINDDFSIEYEILSANDKETLENRKSKISEEINKIESQSAVLEEKLNELNQDIDRLTSNADGFDYIVAVGTGIICGLIDSFFVGEFDVEHFKENKEKVTKKIENIVTEKGKKTAIDEKIKKEIEKAKNNAKKKGTKLTREKENEIRQRITASIKKTFQDLKKTDSENGTKKALEKAMIALQDKFKIPSDNLWNGAGIGVSSETHHLDDFVHHPTIIGFFAAIVSHLFRIGLFVNKDGKWSVQLDNFKDKNGVTDKKAVKKWLFQILLPITLSALLTWLLYIIKSKNKDKIDEKIPRPIQKLILFLAEVPAIIVILEIANNWLGHLISDMAGSSSSAKKGREGMGIPGLFMSLFKYLASVPPLCFTPLPKVVDELYRDERFDLRAELASLDQLGKQAIPVIAGDLLVRAFYFIRRLAQEYKEHGDWKTVNWRNVIPFKNRTIVRMMTIESGTFTAIDLADAAIRSAIEAGPPTTPAYWSKFVLKINFVGIGRFAIAVGTDVGIGVKRNKLINERIECNAKIIRYTNSKIYYLVENNWILAKDLEECMQSLYKEAENCVNQIANDYTAIQNDIKIFGVKVNQIEKLRPGIRERLKERAIWGI